MSPEPTDLPEAGAAGSSEDPGRPTFEPGPVDESEDGRIGPFRSWRSLYTTVIVYTLLSIVILYVFTVVMDHSAP